MPSESTTFTPSSILFRPRLRNQNVVCLLIPGVEAPGTAPGSEWLITKAFYRYIRFAPALSI
jgi:hypothetical protein